MQSDRDFSADSPAINFMHSCRLQRSRDDVEPCATSNKNTRPSPFECLPTELRWQIYEELGFPIGTKRKAECRDPESCELPKEREVVVQIVRYQGSVKEEIKCHLVPVESYEFTRYDQRLYDENRTCCPLSAVSVLLPSFYHTN